MAEENLISLKGIPPDSDQVTEFDLTHLVTYIRFLDAAAVGQDWRMTIRSVLSANEMLDTAMAKQLYEAYLRRARWMTRVGYRLLRAADNGRGNAN